MVFTHQIFAPHS